jgi:hypothetical protein
MSISAEQFLVTIAKAVDLSALYDTSIRYENGPWFVGVDDDDQHGKELKICWLDAKDQNRPYYRSPWIRKSVFISHQPDSIKNILTDHLSRIEISSILASTPPDDFDITLSFEFPNKTGSNVVISVTATYIPQRRSYKYALFTDSHIPNDQLSDETIAMMDDFNLANYATFIS